MREKHGHCSRNYRSPEWISWHSMKDRCLQKSHPNYFRYGGSGIKICDRWLNSFSNFLSDMGRKPTPKHSIDRIDNSGDYCPDNCRWATASEQQRNTKAYRTFTHNDINANRNEWSLMLGGNKTLVNIRLRRGWSIERALSTPPRIYKWRRYDSNTLGCAPAENLQHLRSKASKSA
jgi:hypothetical protein